jgi:DNA-binding transcriptional ArsR family regulator
VVEYYQSAELDRVFSALADPTRRAILQALTRHPATINEIARPFPVSLNAVSKHVMVLERAGLVRREVKGREHYCWIEPQPLRDADVWLKKYEQFWEQRMDALEAYVARKFKASKRRTKRGNDR